MMWRKFCQLKISNLRHATVRYATSERAGGNHGNPRRHLWLLVIPVTTFCLGTWQVFRLQWKIDMIDKMELRLIQSPVTMPTNIKDCLEEFEYRRVSIHGHYDHSRELHMWPRVQVNELRSSSGGGMGRQGGEPGAYVFTPFYVNETKSYILVNRGWVPKNRMDPSTRLQGQIEGDIELTAVVRCSESRNPFGPKNEPDKNYWAWRDVQSMSLYAGTDPVMVDADATSTVPGGPIGGQTKVTIRNEHLQYVFTWYALCVATGYMCWQFWKKYRKK